MVTQEVNQPAITAGTVPKSWVSVDAYVTGLTSLCHGFHHGSLLMLCIGSWMPSAWAQRKQQPDQFSIHEAPFTALDLAMVCLQNLSIPALPIVLHP
eukprot:scaffold278581_cov18-Tisochrysis_lutea.AAC.1